MIVNCTKHTIDVVFEDGAKTSFPPSGFVVETTPIETPMKDTNNIPTIARSFGIVHGFPVVTKPDDILLVSSLVLEASKTNPTPYNAQLRAPDEGPTAVRNDNGQVTAVRRFVRI